MKLTKENIKACKHVILLLTKIIDLNLPYDQLTHFQSWPNTITTFKELKKSGITCCLMGYLATTNKFKKAGGTIYGLCRDKSIPAFNNSSGVEAFNEYVGFDCTEIVGSSHQYSPEKALEWFVLTYQRKLNYEI